MDSVTKCPSVQSLQYKIAVVEDDPNFRNAIVQLLNTDPLLKVVGEAATGKDGARLLRSMHPDVCLCDVKIPYGGGELVAIESKKANSKTRVIALSGCEDVPTIFSMINAGAVSYVIKGATGSEILTTIHQALNGQSSLPTFAASTLTSDILGNKEKFQERSFVLQRVLDKKLITIFLQPIVEMRTGKTLAFEALSRFSVNPPQTPDLWFAEAAKHGLALDFELMAIEEALKHLPHLPDNLPLHINASPVVAMSPRLFEILKDLEAKRVVLEITEHAPIDNYEQLKEALAPLRALGVKISIDDAGSGYSSMSHIVNIEPEIIKLDISLIRDVHKNINLLAMVSALTVFGKQLNLQIIAEGVEVAEERATLLSLGVTFGQGYLFARPSPCSFISH